MNRRRQRDPLLEVVFLGTMRSGTISWFKKSNDYEYGRFSLPPDFIVDENTLILQIRTVFLRIRDGCLE